MTTYQWLSIILVLLGGMWKMNQTLTKIEIALSGKVGYGDCSDRQEKCPCHKEIERIKKDIEKLHPRKQEE